MWTSESILCYLDDFNMLLLKPWWYRYLEKSSASVRGLAVLIPALLLIYIFTAIWIELISVVFCECTCVFTDLPVADSHLDYLFVFLWAIVRPLLSPILGKPKPSEESEDKKKKE